ncbi:MAG: DUF1592 domain-containing protein [Polyangiales bacterium]
MRIRSLFSILGVLLIGACDGRIGDTVDLPPGVELEPPEEIEPEAPVGPGRSKLRRLNAREYRNTIEDFFGRELPADLELPDDTVNLNGSGFDTDGSILSLSGAAEGYYNTAANFGTQMREGGGLSPFAHCAELPVSEIWSCFEPELGWWLGWLHRRPVSEETIARLVTLGQSLDDSYGAAIETLVTYALTSPNFLFHYVRDSTDDAVDPYELADRLSYFVWSSGPDDVLLAAAADSSLLTPEVLEAQTRRLLEDERASRMYQDFSRMWVQLDSLLRRGSNDAEDVLYRDIRQETLLFVETVFVEETLDTLFSADWTFLNQRLADHYGVDAADFGEEFERTPALPQRRGLMTHASVLFAHSPSGVSDPIRRGFWTAGRLVCNPPPRGSIPNVAPLRNTDGGETVREILADHRRIPACASCHEYTDPYGLALEVFDHIGRLRTTYANGRDVDPSGVLPSGETFADANELGEVIVSRGDLPRCINQYLTGYAIGRDLTDADKENAASDLARFSDERGLTSNEVTFRDLVVRIVLSRQFAQAGEMQ